MDNDIKSYLDQYVNINTESALIKPDFEISSNSKRKLYPTSVNPHIQTDYYEGNLHFIKSKIKNQIAKIKLSPSLFACNILFTVIFLIISLLFLFLLKKDSSFIFSILLLLNSVITLYSTSRLPNSLLLTRFNIYKEVIGDKDYCSLTDLQAAADRPKHKVSNDLAKLTSKGYFPEGHVVYSEDIFVLSNKLFCDRHSAKVTFNSHLVYDTNIKAQIKQETANVDKELKSISESSVASKADKQQFKDVVATGRDYISKIKAANEAIPDEVVSVQLSKIELLLEKIFAQISKHPDQINDVQKLIDYYMPMTLKLLNAYIEVDKQGFESESIISIKNEITSLLDPIILAFEKIYNGLFESLAVDVKTDVSVLKTILAQEGLTESILENKNSH